MFYKSKDLVIGLKVEIKGVPYVVLDASFSNIGRGQAFNKLKLKNILNNTVLFKTIKIGEKLKSADIFFKDIKFLYSDNDIFYFFDEDSLDYYEVNKNIIGDSYKWILDGSMCEVTFWNDEIINVKPKKIIKAKVVSNDDIKKDLGTHKNLKYVKIENNSVIKVPIFINNGDFIKIDTIEGLYVSRATD